MAQKVTQKTHLNLATGQDAAAFPAGVWDLVMGQHPALAGPLAPHFTALQQKADQLQPEHPLPYALAGHGHHVAISPGLRASTVDACHGPQDIWPTAPLVVRDLAGRLIHTGLDALPANLPPYHFPPHATPLPDEHPLNLNPEEDFMALFRLLEWSPYAGTPLTGHPTLHVRALYPNLQDYPYKIRVDSYYQDGFRPPQTERLFVHRADPATAALAAEDVQTRWQKRPQGQRYEAFYEANNGAEWYETLFQQGCTVIPTLEGFNGHFKVTREFGMLDVWPGRAVDGLHTVVAEKADVSPAGTILEVKAPGFLTANQLIPAEVVISNGKNYRSPNSQDPDPQLPNLTLPHPRLSSVWGATWLPTHPRHFESPLLWDWDKSGHFIQVSGPVWDPVHYVYASIPKILKAYRAPHVHAPHRAAVPASMRPLFHPVIAPTWYDTVSDLTHQSRQTHPDPTPWQHSRLDAVPLGKPASNLGYHPLPVAYEYELAPEAFPERDPRHLNLAECPPQVQARLLDPISSNITVEQAQKALVLLGENPRQEVLQPVWWSAPPFADLERYEAMQVDAETPPESQLSLVSCAWPDVAASQLAINPKRLFNQGINQALNSINGGLAAAALRWQENALANRRRWHRVLRKYPGWYLHAWLLNVADTPESAWQNQPDLWLPGAWQALQNQRGGVMQVAKAVASKASPRLPARRRSAKLAGR